MKKLDYHFGIKKQLKRRTAKKLTPLVKHLLSPKIIVEAGIIVLVLCAGVSALIIQHNHNKPTLITTKPISSTDSNSCLLSNSGCPFSDHSSTSTQPTPSTPNPTTSPSDSSSTDCTDETIPFTATSEDSASLPAGQTQVVGLGKNGYNVVCDSKIVKTVQPFNIIVVTGTGASTNLEPSTITPTQPNLQPYPTPAPSPTSVEQNGD